jgi:hypothetical protein
MKFLDTLREEDPASAFLYESPVTQPRTAMKATAFWTIAAALAKRSGVNL